MSRAVRLLVTLPMVALATLQTGCCAWTAALCPDAVYTMRADPDTLWLLAPGIPDSVLIYLEGAPFGELYTVSIGTVPGAVKATFPSTTPPANPTLERGIPTYLRLEAVSPYTGTDSVLLGAESVTQSNDAKAYGAVVVTGAKPFTLAVSSQTMTIEAGKVATLPVTLNRAASFLGSVGINGQTSHSGIAATASPSLTPLSTATVVVAVGASVSPGPHSLIVRGTYKNFIDTLVVPLTVTAPPPIADFDMSLTPNPLTIERGSSKSTTLGITRTQPQVGAIQLQGQNVPAGVNLSYSANPANGNTSDITVDVTTAALAGIYTFPISGTWQGITRQASLTLTITDPVYDLTAAPSSLTIARGAAAGLTLSVTRSSPSVGGINLSTQNVPNGVNVTLIGTILTGATLPVVIAASPQALTGQYTFQIIGNAVGVRRVIDVSLTIIDPAFTFTLNPASLTFAPGATVVTQATITRTGLTEPIVFTITNAPANVLGGGGPVTGNSAGITVSSGSGTPLGSYVATVTGTAQTPVATVSYSVQLPLTIQAPLTDFQIVAPASITVVSSAPTSSHSFNIVRHPSYNGVPIQLSFTSNLPAQAQMSINAPNPTTGTTSSVRIYAAPNVPTGTYTLTLTGFANGITRSTTLNVVVQ